MENSGYLSLIEWGEKEVDGGNEKDNICRYRLL